MTHHILTGPYGRDYKSAAAMIKDLEAGRDFQMRDLGNDGCYCSLRDFKPGDQLELRFNKLRGCAVYTVTGKAAEPVKPEPKQGQQDKPDGYGRRDDGLPSHVKWNGEWYETPEYDELESWVNDSVCETPDGETVEPDHPGSWLYLLGLI